jgi:CubicO group peptidase (beta-lactamase class C family)
LSDVRLDIVRSIAARAVPGLSLALIEAGQLAQTAAYGARHSTTGEPVTDHTVFEAASLSKPVFAYVVLQLVDAGMIGLDEPLATRLPTYIAGDARAAAITARHVLTHTTGLPNWRSDDRPLRTYFAPGERFSYSGEGFLYLQRVVERIAGEPLDALVTRLVFAPLGMWSSSYVWQQRFEADHAAPHNEAGEPGRKLKPRDADAAWSLHTTAGDYARFLQAVLAGTHLPPATVGLWLEPAVNAPRERFECLDSANAVEIDERVAWGLGWGLEPGDGTFFHWGANVGSTAFAIGRPRDGRALVFFANSDNGLALAPEIVATAFPGWRPSLAWLGHLPDEPTEGRPDEQEL